MKWKLLSEDHEKRFALVFDAGDEIVTGLIKFAKEHQVGAANFAGIGACERVTLGFFELGRKDYKKIHFDEQVEVMSVLGNVAVEENGEPKVHSHMVVGKSNGAAYGGHLIEAHVRPTLEMFLVEYPGPLHRRMNKQVGLPLIDLSS